MKRFLAVILAVMLLVAVIPATSLAEAARNGDTTMYHVQTKGGTLYVRTGPGTEFASAGFVTGGTVLEKVDLENWIPVIYSGEVRFIGPSAVKK